MMERALDDPITSLERGDASDRQIHTMVAGYQLNSRKAKIPIQPRDDLPYREHFLYRSEQEREPRFPARSGSFDACLILHSRSTDLNGQHLAAPGFPASTSPTPTRCGPRGKWETQWPTLHGGAANEDVLAMLSSRSARKEPRWSLPG